MAGFGAADPYANQLRQLHKLLATGNDAGYFKLVTRLCHQELDEISRHQKNVMDCLRHLVAHGGDETRTRLVCIAARHGILDTSHQYLGLNELLGCDEVRAVLNSQCTSYLAEAGTALHVAAAWAHPRIAAELLQANADPNARDMQGEIPLCKTGGAIRQATAAEDEAVLKVATLMLDHGAEVNLTGSRGRTALMSACSEPFCALAKLLLDRGADLTVRDANGDAALHHVGQYRQPHELVAMLVSANADVNAQGHNEETPLMRATQKGEHKVVAALLNANASVREACPNLRPQHSMNTVGQTEATNVLEIALAGTFTCNTASSQLARRRQILYELIKADVAFFESCREELVETACACFQDDACAYLEDWELLAQDDDGLENDLQQGDRKHADNKEFKEVGKRDKDKKEKKGEKEKKDEKEKKEKKEKKDAKEKTDNKEKKDAKRRRQE